MKNPFRRVRAGDPVLADDYNAHSEAIERLSSTRYGRGLRLRASSKGDIVTLEGEANDDLVPARITGAPSSPTIAESECRYTIRAISNNEWVLDGVRPRYSRPFRGDNVQMIPAKVGDFCYIVRAFAGAGKYDADAWIPTEGYVLAACTPNPALGPGGSFRLFNSIIPAVRSVGASTPIGEGDAPPVGSDA